MTGNKKVKKQMNRTLKTECHRFPYPFAEKRSNLSNEEKIEFIAKRFKEILEILDLNIDDPSLARTPYRVAKMYINEIFSGLSSDSFPEITFIEENFNFQDHPQMIFVNVSFNSFCEHHFVPMVGTINVAYLPNKKVIGLSKIPRIVKYFANRPQIQERLTAQIADCLSCLLETEDVAISIRAQHFCMIARGIEDLNSQTTTNLLGGKFKTDPSRRDEFFAAIK